MADSAVQAVPEILVVDDDAILRELVGDWLEAAGYRVRKAENCAAAAEAVTGTPPRLIVSDMFMPGACGTAAIERLRRMAPASKLIAVSGYFKSGAGLDADEALAAGAERALAKPVRRTELLRAVSELIGPPG